MSIMRVDSQELPLSAIPLCQLFPCHLGPPRPTVSITLYVKGCLDCTIGAKCGSVQVVKYKVKQYFVNVESDYYMKVKVTKWRSLTFTTPCANSADQKLMIFLLCFLENRFDIACKLSPICMKCQTHFLGKIRKIF